MLYFLTTLLCTHLLVSLGTLTQVPDERCHLQWLKVTGTRWLESPWDLARFSLIECQPDRHAAAAFPHRYM